MDLLEKHQRSTEAARAELPALQKEVRRLTARESEWVRRSRAWDRERAELITAAAAASARLPLRQVGGPASVNAAATKSIPR